MSFCISSNNNCKGEREAKCECEDKDKEDIFVETYINNIYILLYKFNFL